MVLRIIAIILFLFCSSHANNTQAINMTHVYPRITINVHTADISKYLIKTEIQSIISWHDSLEEHTKIEHAINDWIEFYERNIDYIKEGYSIPDNVIQNMDIKIGSALLFLTIYQKDRYSTVDVIIKYRYFGTKVETIIGDLSEDNFENKQQRMRLFKKLIQQAFPIGCGMPFVLNHNFNVNNLNVCLLPLYSPDGGFASSQDENNLRNVLIELGVNIQHNDKYVVNVSNKDGKIIDVCYLKYAKEYQICSISGIVKDQQHDFGIYFTYPNGNQEYINGYYLKDKLRRKIISQIETKKVQPVAKPKPKKREKVKIKSNKTDFALSLGINYQRRKRAEWEIWQHYSDKLDKREWGLLFGFYELRFYRFQDYFGYENETYLSFNYLNLKSADDADGFYKGKTQGGGLLLTYRIDGYPETDVTNLNYFNVEAGVWGGIISHVTKFSGSIRDSSFYHDLVFHDTSFTGPKGTYYLGIQMGIGFGNNWFYPQFRIMQLIGSEGHGFTGMTLFNLFATLEFRDKRY